MSERIAETTQAHWHLDKRVNVGHIMTTVTVLAGVMWWGSTIESRVAVLESQTQQTEKVQTEIKGELTRLNGKMDRLLELLIKTRGDQ